MPQAPISAGQLPPRRKPPVLPSRPSERSRPRQVANPRVSVSEPRRYHRSSPGRPQPPRRPRHQAVGKPCPNRSRLGGRVEVDPPDSLILSPNRPRNPPKDSAGRGNKAPPPRTPAAGTAQSSARDPPPRVRRDCHAPAGTPGAFVRGPRREPARVPGPKAYPYPPAHRGEIKSSLVGMDSDLEAFSRYPADGSFAALPCRTAAKTNYLNQRFLSY